LKLVLYANPGIEIKVSVLVSAAIIEKLTASQGIFSAPKK